MRTWLIGWGLLLASSTATAAPRAQLRCLALDAAKEQVLFELPAADHRKIETTLRCVVHLDQSDSGRYEVNLILTQGSLHVRQGTVDKAHDFVADYNPNVDYAPCRDFSIGVIVGAGVEADRYQRDLKLTQACTATTPPVAPLPQEPSGHVVRWDCAQRSPSGEQLEVSARLPLIAYAKLLCTISGVDPGTAAHATFQLSWKVDNAPAHNRVKSAKLDRDGTHVFGADKSEWQSCAQNLVATVKVLDGANHVIANEQQPLPLFCPAPSPTPLPPSTIKPRWSGDDWKSVPSSAKKTVQALTTIFERADGYQLMSQFPDLHVQIGKQTYDSAGLAQTLYQTTGVQPELGGDGDDDRSTDIWHLRPVSSSEFWIYNCNDQYQGPYMSLVFKKSGGSWAWVAVKEAPGEEP